MFHSVRCKEVLQKLRTGPEVTMSSAFGETCRASTYGDIRLNLGQGRILMLENVVHCLAIKENNVPTSQLRKNDRALVSFKKYRVILNNDPEFQLTSFGRQGSYYLWNRYLAIRSIRIKSTDLMHRRFRHAS